MSYYKSGIAAPHYPYYLVLFMRNRFSLCIIPPTRPSKFQYQSTPPSLFWPTSTVSPPIPILPSDQVLLGKRKHKFGCLWALSLPTSKSRFHRFFVIIISPGLPPPPPVLLSISRPALLPLESEKLSSRGCCGTSFSGPFAQRFSLTLSVSIFLPTSLIFAPQFPPSPVTYFCIRESSQGSSLFTRFCPFRFQDVGLDPLSHHSPYVSALFPRPRHFRFHAHN